MAAAPAGSRVLDVATGTGNQALAFARQGYEVTGVDLSDEMLRVARGKDGCGRTTFINADASALPFGDCSFEVAAVSFALHDMPPMREAALGELVRVTVPGGTVMVVDYEIPRDFVHRLFIRYMLARHEERLRALLFPLRPGGSAEEPGRGYRGEASGAEGRGQGPQMRRRGPHSKALPGGYHSSVKHGERLQG